MFKQELGPKHLDTGLSVAGTVLHRPNGKRLLLEQCSRGDVAARQCLSRTWEWKQRRDKEKRIAEPSQGGEDSLPLCTSVEVKLPES